MKKLFLTACIAVATAFSANAQKVTVRAEVGGNITNVDSKIKDHKLSSDVLVGVRAGAGVEFNFAEMIYAATGLNYHMGGSERSIDLGKGFLNKDKSATLKNRTHTLSIPINLGVRVPLGDFAVSAEVGPYVAYTLSTKGSVEGLGEDIFNKLTDGKDIDLKDLRNQFEAGVGASVAGEYKSFYLRLGTTWGLTNMAKVPEDAVQKALNINVDDLKNHEFYLTFGIRF